MPIRNEAQFIERSLRAVLNQDYPLDRMEIIVVDGMSSDGSREIIDSVQGGSAIVRCLDNPRKTVAAGLNAAIRESRGEIIVRVDGHSEVADNFIRQCVRHLKEDGLHCVGGPIDTIGTTRKGEAIALGMSSYFGVGGATFRTVRDRAMPVDTVAFPAYSRELLEAAGVFDEELVRNQDDEYNYRLRKLGFKVFLCPDVCSKYYSRSSLWALSKQYFQYGFWKVRVMQKHPQQMRLRQFVPPLFTAVLFGSLALSWLIPYSTAVFILTVCCYAKANLVASILSAGQKGWQLLPFLPIAYATIHLSYGLGFLVGLVRFLGRWVERKKT